MYGTLKVAAVVPARNEERLIGRTIWPVPEIIDTIYPEGNRIELFARREADEWEVWGNEITTT